MAGPVDTCAFVCEGHTPAPEDPGNATRQNMELGIPLDFAGGQGGQERGMAGVVTRKASSCSLAPEWPCDPPPPPIPWGMPSSLTGGGRGGWGSHWPNGQRHGTK